MMEVFEKQNYILQAILATLFTWGVTSLGAATVFLTRSISRRVLGAMLGFAASAMVFVVVEEVIPESQRDGNTDLATMGVLIGFVVMMILDVGLS